jgi:hypothetical protein
MKKIFIILLLILFVSNAHSQGNTLYQTGLTAEQNLSAIGNLSRYANAGGNGFDNRYEGVKGSPRLFDTLLPSFLNIKGKDYCLQLKTNIDLSSNSLIFIYPNTGKLLSISSDIIKEVRISLEGKEMVFRTASGNKFVKDFKGHRFFQVLKDGQYQFIKLPIKKLIEADYKAVYGADRRYDEYTTYYKYYILSPDSIFRQIQLNKKSLIKVFPDKKDLINSTIRTKTYENDEDMVIDFLNNF